MTKERKVTKLVALLQHRKNLFQQAQLKIEETEKEFTLRIQRELDSEPVDFAKIESILIERQDQIDQIVAGLLISGETNATN
jgi:hypothetical protein